MDSGINPIKPKKCLSYPDRISISEGNLTKVNALIEQAHVQIKGINLSRNDLVNFLIRNHAEQLAAGEIKQIEKEFFDEVRFAKWALKELKAAKARGEGITLAEIVSAAKTKPVASPRKPKKFKSEEKNFSGSQEDATA